MNEIFRDENLLAVILPPQARTLHFRYERIVTQTRFYRLPPSLAVFSKQRVAFLVSTGEEENPNIDSRVFYRPLLPSVGAYGVVCMGNVSRQKTLDDARDQFLDLFFQRPFDGLPAGERIEREYDERHRKHRETGTTLFSPREAIFDFAFHSGMDARPYREHRYLGDANQPVEGQLRTYKTISEIPESQRRFVHAVFKRNPNFKLSPEHKNLYTGFHIAQTLTDKQIAETLKHENALS